LENKKNPKTSADIQFTNIPWLQNTDFSSPTIDPWFNTTQGDIRDVEASFTSDQADFLVLGEEGTIKISNVFTDPSNDWTDFRKDELDNYPNNGNSVSTEGIFSSHLWSDGTANQIPKIFWRYNVSLNLDMSDYEITSASIQAVINASVDRNVDVPGDTISVYPSQPLDITSSFDYIYFTIEVSDMNISEDNTYKIAENRTRYLGRYDGVPPYLDLEKLIDPKEEQDIIFGLDRVLEADSEGHNNFTLVLGISTHSTDNADGPFDFDDFDAMRFKSVNLTFTYKKKMDIFSSVSWNQEGGMINYTSVQVTDAKLNFEHKIDKNWTETTSFLAENSELRFLINGFPSNNYPTIKLSSMQDTYQEAISGDYDVTNLIPLNESITLSIQVHLADDFILDQLIKISIDNVKFTISYIVFNQTVSVVVSSGGGGGSGKTKVIEEPLINLILAIAAIAGGIFLGGYLIAYQLVLKYPKPVRKVRKYRKTLKRKKVPTVNITGKKNAFKEIFNTEIASIKGLFSSATSQKIAAKDKIVQKSLQISSEKIIKKSLKKPLDKKSKST
jgi:hypothetical protein